MMDQLASQNRDDGRVTRAKFVAFVSDLLNPGVEDRFVLEMSWHEKALACIVALIVFAGVVVGSAKAAGQPFQQLHQVSTRR